MKLLLHDFFILFGVFCLVSAENSSRNSRALFNSLPKPFLETYWESYFTWPNPYDLKYPCTPLEDWTDPTDYVYSLGSIPIQETGVRGVNIVNIAFAHPNPKACHYWGGNCMPLVCGLNLHTYNDTDAERIVQLKSDIQTIQSKGGLVKLAFGGQSFGNIDPDMKITYPLDMAVENMVDAVNELNLDGVDLTQDHSCGVDNLNCNDQTSVHLYVLSHLRQQLPHKIISYTISGYPTTVEFPFRDVMQYGHHLLDYISIYRTDINGIDDVIRLGVPKEKIVWGVRIPVDCDLNGAMDVATDVKYGGYLGTMLWSINRDTDHRMDYDTCSNEQSGLPDGTFVKSVSDILTS